MPTGASNKRKYNYIWISAVILVFGIIFIPKIVDRLKQGNVVENDRMASAEDGKPLSYLYNDGEKRRVPNFSFYNHDSVLVTQETYLGKVYVAEFFFTTCPTICPIMTKNLLEIQKTFSEEEDFGIASFTINPRYDTPEVLRGYRKKYALEYENWHLLTHATETVYELANEGFYMIADEDETAPGGFEHSGLFALIDKEGYLRSRVDKNGNPIIYYRGTVTQEEGENKEGEVEQISILKEDIKKLLAE